MESSFSTPGIVCHGCAGTIKNALGMVPGVSAVGVDVAAKTVTVAHDQRAPRQALAAALERAGYPAAGHGDGAVAAAATANDPVCGMDVVPSRAAGSVRHDGQAYFFCSPHCLETFRAAPARFVGEGDGGRSRHSSAREAPAVPAAGTIYTCPMHPEIVRDEPGSCPPAGWPWSR